ncbi:efflux RND transporter periplasmic adaptor subunit [Reinekea sp.]|uniref:efflux RND transporter periplasmic adaptor subunit n=1 Tax=Reinekea sp. TaxID=1970455 RepID=UPI002A8352CC|nr:HlyD family efflux transporter periplasmic adaptor subunit [Reinekea sp.]
MLKKFIIPVVILAIALGAYRMMTTPSDKPGGARAAAPVSAPTPEPAQEESTQVEPTQAQAKPGDEASTTTAKAETPAAAEPKPSARSGRGGGFRGAGRFGNQAATSVEVIPALADKTRAQLDLFGVIEAQHHTRLTATSNARVLALNINEGQSVQQGQSLLSLAAESASEALAQRRSARQELDARMRNETLKHGNDQATLDIDRELLRIAKNSVDRFTSLNSQQLTSGSDYEAALRAYQMQLMSVQKRELTLAQYKDQMLQMQAQRDALASQIRLAEQLVADLQVTAPFTGLVAKVAVSQGQELRSGDVLVELYDPTSLALFVRVPLRYRLDQLDSALISAIDSHGQAWQVQALRPINESGAQRLTLVPNATSSVPLLPGSHVALTLSYPIAEPAVEVPVTAVYDQQRVYLFEGGVIVAADIEILGRTDQGYLVRSAEFSDQAAVVTTRLKTPVSGMAVAIVTRTDGARP